MLILSQFVLRLSFGLAFAMAITSPKKVTSGFFRNHAYVLLGLNVLALLAAFADRSELLLWPSIVGAALSYLCAAVWLYEKPRPGIALLGLIFFACGLGAILDSHADLWPSYQGVIQVWPDWEKHFNARVLVWGIFDPLTSGFLLGGTIAAMFLGHWYLNSPTMEIAPLKKLLALMGVAVALRAIVCVASLMLLLRNGIEPSTVQTWLLVLRWTAGILGTAILTWMAWETLRIPNTQSATGILYVAVLATFLGELTSLLLSAGTGYPL
jgi:hypothetical protein